MKYITTSWDDGHPLDFRIAELLNKYNLQGTFYIPKTNEEHEVMSEIDIVSLSKEFEIGGHTMNHFRLESNTRSFHEHEIISSFKWLSELLHYGPISFCFPSGVYDKEVILTAKKAGYLLFRTVELLSIDHSKTQLLKTSLQLYHHNQFTYFKHLVKRRRTKNLIQWLQSGSLTHLLHLTDYYLNIIEKKGSGSFHLWGHSWEIEEYGLWQKLEEVFHQLSTRTGFQYIQNKDILKTHT